jgi:hypothetical protein
MSSMRVSKIRSKTRRVHGSPAKLRSRRSNFVSRAFIASKHKKLMPAGSKKERNLFAVKNFKKVDKNTAEFDMELIYKFDLPVTQTPKKPFLEPACEKVSKDAQKIFISQMTKLGM